MATPSQLWAQYDVAVKSNNLPLAQAILKQLQNFKSHPAVKTGCSRCRKTL